MSNDKENEPTTTTGPKEKIIIIDDGSIGSQILEKEYSQYHQIEKVKAKNLPDLLTKITKQLEDENKITKIFLHNCLEECNDEFYNFINDARTAYPNIRLFRAYEATPKTHLENRAKNYGITIKKEKELKEKEQEPTK